MMIIPGAARAGPTMSGQGRASAAESAFGSSTADPCLVNEHALKELNTRVKRTAECRRGGAVAR